MIEKNKIWFLQHLHFDLCFGGEGGMLGLSHALVPAQESKRWSFGHLLLLPVIQKGLFLGPKKARKIRHANTGLPSSRFLPRMLFVLKQLQGLTFCAHRQSAHLTKWRDQKQARQEGPLSILRGSTFGSLLNIFALRKGPKLGPQHSESGASLGLVWRPIQILSWGALLESGHKHQRHTIATTSWQPGPQTREAPTVSPKSLLISGAKNEPSGHGKVLLLKWQEDQ